VVSSMSPVTISTLHLWKSLNCIKYESSIIFTDQILDIFKSTSKIQDIRMVNALTEHCPLRIKEKAGEYQVLKHSLIHPGDLFCCHGVSHQIVSRTPWCLRRSASPPFTFTGSTVNTAVKTQGSAAGKGGGAPRCFPPAAMMDPGGGICCTHQGAGVS